MKISEIPISRLNKPDLKEYLENFHAEAVKCETVTQTLSGQWASFQEAYMEFERICLIAKKSDLTKEIHLLGSQCFSILVSIKTAVDSLRKSMDEETMRKATSVWNSINSFKVNSQAGYIAQMGQLDTILQVLTSKQMDNLESLKLTDMLNLAIGFNRQMHALVSDRDEENTGKLDGEFDRARKAIEEQYRLLVDIINAWQLLEVEYKNQPDAALARFIEIINAVIVRFKRYALVEGGSKPGEDEVTDDDQTPPTYENPEQTPGETPEQTPGETPEQTPGENPEQTPEQTPGENPGQNPEGGENTGSDNENQGGSGDNGGNNGNYPPGYDPDADDDPGV